MADKSKKGDKPGAPPPGGKKEGEQPPGEGKKGKEEGKGKEEEKKEEPPPKPKSVQPKDDVGTRKGCRRYKWELKDSNKEFWVMGHAEVKFLSLGCLLAALVMFTGTVVHPLLSLIITMEMSIFLFFIIIYTFAINRYMPFILWPVTILIGVAAFFPLIDICLQRKHFRGKKVKKNVLVPPQKMAGAPKEEPKGEAAKPKDDKKGKPAPAAGAAPAGAAAAKPGKK
ncbi:PREDICTED: CKLF-like MARVEL transmembrane domain-containing protein 2 isoform X2 [Myotis brandtii]|uniref:CKLF-like MARVEL transmembrane domain-containing protein 2 isoform X2 n=1 Tax=Myotis brandtii TaxID=109478 RepID=UPI0003BBFEFA|nr:PREDICTED: CKLF-like MARVEL transmembrane domain-containing protein 2 isoform X2 [Myotis brandtii]